ncbi:hypothetical protein [Jannaschia sp. LMIT008]|uniref:hypothetical protein n=1 Tax=Jannaschia maritima TaxID=3032585 RepID=UPI002810DC54|nr:hypothetical protein [Jannaschia sp. LMIT008]
MSGPQSPAGFASAADGATAHGSAAIDDPTCLCDDNWVKIRYEHADGSGVAGASYIVQTVTGDATGEVLAQGVTDGNGDAVATLPSGIEEVEFYFFDDPEGEPYEDPEARAPVEEPEEGFFARLWDDIAEAGDWVWGVIQGDFNEDASTSQIIARMILTMIPGIDQLADAQDIVNILYRLIWRREWDVPAHWILLVITLIGLIPTFGSLAKGILKMVLRRAGDIGALRSLYGVFNFFGIGNAHRWLKEFSRRLTGDILDWAVGELNRLLNRAAAYMDWAKTRLGGVTGWNARLNDGIARVGAFRGVATEKLREAATTLQRRLAQTLAAAMSRIGRGGTRNGKAHTVKQNVEAPPARVPRHPRTQDELDDLARDPSHGGRISRSSEAERDVGLGLEERGEVPGPIRRDPTGGAEFIDADGVEWDVKAYNSNFPNGFDPARVEEQLDLSRRLGENVMIDTRNISAADMNTLRQIVGDNGFGEIVRFWP